MATPNKTKTKFVSGPGGINCRCCRCGTKRDAKRGTNRHIRRKGKEEVKADA